MSWILLIGLAALGLGAMALACWRIDLVTRWHEEDFEMPAMRPGEGGW
jgi:hypothetical protein